MRYISQATPPMFKQIPSNTAPVQSQQPPFHQPSALPRLGNNGQVMQNLQTSGISTQQHSAVPMPPNALQLGQPQTVAYTAGHIMQPQPQMHATGQVHVAPQSLAQQQHLLQQQQHLQQYLAQQHSFTGQAAPQRFANLNRPYPQQTGSVIQNQVGTVRQPQMQFLPQHPLQAVRPMIQQQIVQAPLPNFQNQPSTQPNS